MKIFYVTPDGLIIPCRIKYGKINPFRNDGYKLLKSLGFGELLLTRKKYSRKRRHTYKGKPKVGEYKMFNKKDTSKTYTFMKLGRETTVEIDNEYTGLGTCGMTKDETVMGVLTEVKLMNDSAILTDSRGIPCEVALKTLKEQ